MRIWLLPLVLSHALLGLAGCSGAGAPPAGATESAKAPSENGIVNFHTVHPFLFRSGHVAKGDMPELASLGVKTILSLEDYGGDSSLADAEQSAATANGMSVEWQPMSPSAKPTLDEINQALSVITDPSRQPVLVHCKHGSDRTGIIIAAYRIMYDGYTEAQAIAEMKAFGHYSGLFFWDSVLDGVTPAQAAN